MNRRFRTSLLISACLLTWPRTMRADSPADQLRTQESHEQQLRSQTQTIAQQIDLIISEFDRNGMGHGQDVKTLRSIRAVLGELSDEQMQKVIVLLQQARGASDGGLTDEKQAYSAQQGIIGQFRDLLNQYEKDKSLYELSDRFDRLAKRQAANLRSAVDLAQTSAGKKVDQLDAAASAALATQQSEQASLAGETTDALSAAKGLLDSLGGADADQLNKALAAANSAHLFTMISAAAADLQTDDLFRASGEEKDARDTLRELTDLLSPPKDALEVKKDQLAKVEALLERQKEIVDQTRARALQKSAAIPLRDIDRPQAANVDDTDDSRRKLANLSPEVADTLKQAENKMQRARGDNAQHRRDQSAKDSNAAADELQLAKEGLEKEIARADADAAKNAPQEGEEIAQTKELIDQVKSLRAQQHDLANNVPSTQPVGTPLQQQRSLAEKAQTLQQEAATRAPVAATQLGEAGKQMADAVQSMERSDQPTTAAQQQAADAALAKAEDGLEQQANQLQQAQSQLNQLQQAQEAIGDLIKQQAQVALATAKQAATQPTDSQTSPQAAQSPATQTAASEAQASPATQPADPQSGPADTAQQQQQVAQQTVAAAAQMPGQAQQAADAMKDAQQQMQQAAQQLQKGDAHAAQPAQGEAISDLGKAAVGLEGAMDQLKSQLGQPAGDPAAAQAAADAINQATQQLQQAQGQLDKAQSGQPAETAEAQKSLNAAAQSAAQAMGKNDSQAAAQALGQAISQMNQAGGQAQQGQAGQAAQSTAAAQAALEQAKAALAADSPETGSGQAKGPGQSPSSPSGDAPATPEAGDQSTAQSNSLEGGKGNTPGERAAQEGGSRGGTAGKTAFVQLPARDRQALQQSQAEKYPEEYGTMVEQYLRNLSDSDNK
jgi:trimeric autotransporter adhesin